MDQDWKGFFSTVAQVAITAFSVMFLALQVHSSRWSSRVLGVVEAASALVELFVPMLVALIAGMGTGHWRIGSWIAGVLGLGLVGLHLALYRSRRNDAASDDDKAFDRLQVYWGAPISLVIYLCVFNSGFVPAPAGLYMLGSACVWLLLSGSFEAWMLLEPDLLIRIGRRNATNEPPRNCETPHAPANENEQTGATSSD